MFKKIGNFEFGWLWGKFEMYVGKFYRVCIKCFFKVWFVFVVFLIFFVLFVKVFVRL